MGGTRSASGGAPYVQPPVTAALCGGGDADLDETTGPITEDRQRCDRHVTARRS